MKNVIFLLIILFPMVSFSQNNNDTFISKKQYIELINRVKNLEEKVNTDKTVLKKAKTALEVSNMYSKSADKSLNLIMDIIKVLTFVIIFLGIGGVYGLFKYLKDSMDNLEKKIEKEISQTMNQKEKTIFELFDKHEKEKGLLSTSRILILNKHGTDINKYELEILKKFKHFDKFDLDEDLKTFDDEKITNKDVVIFDNTNTIPHEENWDFSNNEKLKDKLIEIASSVCKQNVAFIFFGKNDGGFIKDIPEHSHLISFSNNPATLFSNLINLLELRRLLGIK